MDHESLSQDDKHVIDLWDESCKKVDNHYELPIPLKDPEESIPNNFVVVQEEKALKTLLT